MDAGETSIATRGPGDRFPESQGTRCIRQTLHTLVLVTMSLRDAWHGCARVMWSRIYTSVAAAHRSAADHNKRLSMDELRIRDSSAMHEAQIFKPCLVIINEIVDSNRPSQSQKPRCTYYCLQCNCNLNVTHSDKKLLKELKACIYKWSSELGGAAEAGSKREVFVSESHGHRK